MQKYQGMVAKMVEEHKELFNNFGDIHREYAQSPKEWQKLFNQYGTEVVEIIREYERRLCANMATGKYGQFSRNLSEKFLAEVKKIFPKIDFVGVKIES